MISSESHNLSQLPSPDFRIQITLFYVDKTLTVPNNTTLIKRSFVTAKEANDEVLELATACRADGEVVVLVDKRIVGDAEMHEYLVGKWEREGPIARSHHELIEETHPYMLRRVKGVLSGRVQVVLQHDEQGLDGQL